MEEEKRHRGLSKKGKLILSNVIAFVVLLVVWYIEAIHYYSSTPDIAMFKYLMAMCAFAIMSLIVYYLSIIADAINSKANVGSSKKSDAVNEKSDTETQKKE